MMAQGQGHSAPDIGQRMSSSSIDLLTGPVFFCRHDLFSKVVRRIPKPFTARRQSVTENCECIWPHKETSSEKNITDDIYRKYIKLLTKQRLRKGSRHINIKKKLFF